jgi:hypothetical protein
MTLTSEGLTDDVQASPAAHAVELRKTYGAGQAAGHALAGVNVTFERGRFTAVMGPPTKVDQDWPARRAGRLDVLAAIAAE